MSVADAAESGAARRSDYSIASLAICVATCGRPVWLERLLGHLTSQARQASGGVSIQVIVCDNDPAGSAARVVADCAGIDGLGFLYVHETTRGISFARNALVRAALDRGADGILFVDDDEVPDPDWLSSMIATQRRYDAAIVLGPVVPEYERGTPDWVIRGRFFERPFPATGTRLDMANSGNVLIHKTVFERVGGFDERFALTGGEDTHFFFRANRRGFAVVAAAEAIARETVPLSRTTVGWLVKRAYRNQSSYVRCEREMLPPATWIPRRGIKVLWHISSGLARIAASVLLGKASMVGGLRYVARGLGGISAAFGGSYQEYQTIHGR